LPPPGRRDEDGSGASIGVARLAPGLEETVVARYQAPALASKSTDEAFERGLPRR
jgi:hypothetical protein